MFEELCKTKDDVNSCVRLAECIDVDARSFCRQLRYGIIAYFHVSQSDFIDAVTAEIQTQPMPMFNLICALYVIRVGKVCNGIPAKHIRAFTTIDNLDAEMHDLVEREYKMH